MLEKLDLSGEEDGGIDACGCEDRRRSRRVRWSFYPSATGRLMRGVMVVLSYVGDRRLLCVWLRGWRSGDVVRLVERLLAQV